MGRGAWKSRAGFQIPSTVVVGDFNEIQREDLERMSQLQLQTITASQETGPDLVVARDGRQVFIMGRPEYDARALHEEYFRDLELRLPIPLPVTFYPEDDPTTERTAFWQL